MALHISNVFDLEQTIVGAEEIVETLATGDAVTIERIVSRGNTTAENQWYDQPRDEWVIVLQGDAQLGYDDGSTQALGPGDWLLIPARKRHRVKFTSVDPPCIWLAVHGNLSGTLASR